MSPLPHEIIAAFAEHTTRPRQDQLNALMARRIDRWALAGAPNTGELGIGFARISREGVAGFDFAGDGEPGMAVIALDAFREPVDIVGWSIKGDWIGAWLGRAPILGEQHIAGPRLDEALAIYPTPLQWLRGNRQGVVLVDKPRAAYALRDADPFLAMGGFEHAAQLVALLSAPPPKVLIPDPGEQRRAA